MSTFIDEINLNTVWKYVSPSWAGNFESFAYSIFERACTEDKIAYLIACGKTDETLRTYLRSSEPDILLSRICTELSKLQSGGSNPFGNALSAAALFFAVNRFDDDFLSACEEILRKSPRPDLLLRALFESETRSIFYQTAEERKAFRASGEGIEALKELPEGEAEALPEKYRNYLFCFLRHCFLHLPDTPSIRAAALFDSVNVLFTYDEERSTLFGDLSEYHAESALELANEISGEGTKIRFRYQKLLAGQSEEMVKRTIPSLKDSEIDGFIETYRSEFDAAQAISLYREYARLKQRSLELYLRVSSPLAYYNLAFKVREHCRFLPFMRKQDRSAFSKTVRERVVKYKEDPEFNAITACSEGEDDQLLYQSYKLLLTITRGNTPFAPGYTSLSYLLYHKLVKRTPGVVLPGSDEYVANYGRAASSRMLEYAGLNADDLTGEDLCVIYSALGALFGDPTGLQSYSHKLYRRAMGTAMKDGSAPMPLSDDEYLVLQQLLRDFMHFGRVEPTLNAAELQKKGIVITDERDLLASLEKIDEIVPLKERERYTALLSFYREKTGLFPSPASEDADPDKELSDILCRLKTWEQKYGSIAQYLGEKMKK